MKSIRALYLPYCVVVLDSGRVALLNRDYRHLGESRLSREERESEDPQEQETWMPHEEYWGAYLEKGSVKYEGLTREALEEICHKPLRREWEGREIYIGWLYCDATVPTRSKANWEAYTARLEKLAAFGDWKEESNGMS